MADLVKLKSVIDDRGMGLTTIAERSGIKRWTLERRLKGFGEFTASEIVGLSRALRLTRNERDNIFLH